MKDTRIGRVGRAVASAARFCVGRLTAFARHTVAVFRPTVGQDAFPLCYDRGGRFDTVPHEERLHCHEKNIHWKNRYLKAVAALLSVMTLCVAVLWVGRLWKITDVQVEGCTNYAPAAVAQASGLRQGDEYLGADPWTVERRIAKAMPLAKDVTVVKHLNGTVVITVTEYDELYYTQFHENYYAITPEGMQVLEVSVRGDVYRSMGAVYIGLPEDARVRVGEALSYMYAPYLTDDETEEAFTYEVEHEDPTVEYTYVSTVIDTVMAWELSDRVTGMELSDRYAMYAVVDGQVLIKLGNKNDLEAKLALASRVLAEQTLGELVVVLDVSDGKTASVREDATFEMPDWTGFADKPSSNS